MFNTRSVATITLAIAMVAPTPAQNERAAEPVVGLRSYRTETFALTNGLVMKRPGESIPDATVLIRGTSIVAVGPDLEVPPGAQSIDCSGLTLYAGWIDAWGETDVPPPPTEAAHWNANVTPQRSTREVAATAIDDGKRFRSQGFTAKVLAPRGGILRGSSSVVLLNDAGNGSTILKDHAWQHAQLTVPRGTRPRYPNSPMGAVALLRQSMYDAQWYRDAMTAYHARPELPRPEVNHALAALGEAMQTDTFVIDAPNERMAIRANDIAQEFSLGILIRGSGREYRRLDEIVSASRPILVPVDFPDAPHVKTARAAQDTSLSELLHWQHAAENPARLDAAGLPICLTTDGLSDVNKFLDRVRQAVRRGLPERAALKALTTTPASLLNVDDTVGQIAPGMLANLVIADGNLFVDGSKVRETWVAGERFVVEQDAGVQPDMLAGTWETRLKAGGKYVPMRLELRLAGDRWSGKLTRVPQNPAANENADSEPADKTDETSDDDSAPPLAELEDVVHDRDGITASIRLDKIDPAFDAGISRLRVLVIRGPQPRQFASIDLPTGETDSIRLTAVTETDGPDQKKLSKEIEQPSKPADDSEPIDASDGEGTGRNAMVANSESVPPEISSDETVDPPDEIPVLYPLGAYGVTTTTRQPEHVMFRGGTVWTCDDRGMIESGDVLIRDGQIVAVGEDLDLPAGCRVIDVSGKHLTPGLIDCHSHMATDGGVNESGQAVTAEVRIGDFIDNSDINIYRQLAGGLTTSNILHGSANPIGGQNQVIKLRWGQSMDGLRMIQAPAGIKFALGENVKRSTSRYPNTRMGVEQILRDQLLAAREYDAAWRRWRSGERDSLPPRVDLQLQALAEVQRAERWIHCHSYRQDEIIATLDVLEEFGIRIGTLQHILEGYKVADRMARHGAMGSAFSDWWAYKFEVYDAIPYNGAVMHDRGVVVSFNSDDRELARRLNTEAAKATKYGGVSEIQALQFVTLNPAKQLRIEQYVGSLTPGKHADLVVWSGRPLSTMSRCEQTWIDGCRYFDLASDAEARRRDLALRNTLIHKVLEESNDSQPDDGADETDPDSVAEEDRWLRHDAFCAASAGQNRDQRSQGDKR